LEAVDIGLKIPLLHHIECAFFSLSCGCGVSTFFFEFLSCAWVLV
jgi:hypothetical protein